MDLDNDDDDFKIHPKKTQEELGSLAVTENSWYENEREDEEDCDSNSDDEDGEESGASSSVAFPTITRPTPPLPVPVMKQITAVDLMKTTPEALVASAAGNTKLLMDLAAYASTLVELLEPSVAADSE